MNPDMSRCPCCGTEDMNPAYEISPLLIVCEECYVANVEARALEKEAV